jgi:hypothetical protein
MAKPDDTKSEPLNTRIDEGEDDVEGHRSMSPRVDAGPDEFGLTRVSSRRIDEDEDDVEGHYGQLGSPSSRGE